MLGLHLFQCCIKRINSRTSCDSLANRRFAFDVSNVLNVFNNTLCVLAGTASFKSINCSRFLLFSPFSLVTYIICRLNFSILRVRFSLSLFCFSFDRMEDSISRRNNETRTLNASSHVRRRVSWLRFDRYAALSRGWIIYCEPFRRPGDRHVPRLFGHFVSEYPRGIGGSRHFRSRRLKFISDARYMRTLLALLII